MLERVDAAGNGSPGPLSAVGVSGQLEPVPMGDLGRDADLRFRERTFVHGRPIARYAPGHEHLQHASATGDVLLGERLDFRFARDRGERVTVAARFGQPDAATDQFRAQSATGADLVSEAEIDVVLLSHHAHRGDPGEQIRQHVGARGRELHLGRQAHLVELPAE